MIWRLLLPEDVMGEVMGDLQTRRSLIMGMDSKENYQVIKARTPLAELDRYSTTLRSLSQGRAGFTQHFADFATVPYDLQSKLRKTGARSRTCILAKMEPEANASGSFVMDR